MEVDTTNESKRIQISLITKENKYSVPNDPIYVTVDSGPEELNELVLSQLDVKGVTFDFLVYGEILFTDLNTVVEERVLSLDQLVEVEYFLKQTPPVSQAELEHGDFVSSVASMGNYVITGVYDRSVHLWSISGPDEPVLVIPAHEREVKAVHWLSLNQVEGIFVSGGHDQDCMLWCWNLDSNEVTCLAVCKGHSNSVLSLTSCSGGTRFVSGSFDGSIKIWSADKTCDLIDETGGIQHIRKSVAKIPTRLPLVTLGGHKDAVHALVSGANSEVFSGGSDSFIRNWDIESGLESSKMRSSSAVLSLDYNKSTKLLLAGCADTVPKVYDPRSTTDFLSASYSAHKSWVSGVKWCPTADHLFVTGGYDYVVKVWDVRGLKAPLYDIHEHSEIVTGVDWTDSGYLLSSSADHSVKVHLAQPIR